MSEKIQKLVAQSMKKKYGEFGVTTTTDLAALGRIPYGISAQCLSLDLIIGRPGFPAGRLTEICAPEGSAKSMHGYHILAETQRKKGIGILIETESAVEMDRLTQMGVKIDDLLISEPKHLEEAFAMIEDHIILIREKAKFTGPVTIVFDSIAATPSSTEVEKSFDGASMASAARVISLSLRKLIQTIARHKIVLIFLNQLRATMDMYGEPFVSYGGKAIKYHASLRLMFNMPKSKFIKDQTGTVVGANLRAQAIKNKLAPPFMMGTYNLYFATGIDPESDLLQSGLAIGFLEGKQGKYRYQGKSFTKDIWPKVIERLGGLDHLRDVMTEHAIQIGVLKAYV